MLGVPGLEATGANSNEVVVGMPVNAEDSGAYRLLDMFAYPPGGGGGGGGGGREGGREGGIDRMKRGQSNETGSLGTRPSHAEEEEGLVNLHTYKFEVRGISAE